MTDDERASTASSHRLTTKTTRPRHRKAAIPWLTFTAIGVFAVLGVLICNALPARALTPEQPLLVSPGSLDGAAVSATVTRLPTTRTAPASMRGVASAAHGGRCAKWSKWAGAVVSYKNAFGNVTASYISRLHFCYDLISRVTYANAYTEASIPLWASWDGWEYDGTVESTEAWVPYRRHYHGAFRSWKEGHFKFCPIHFPFCVSYYPRIHLTGHYDAWWSWWADK